MFTHEWFSIYNLHSSVRVAGLPTPAVECIDASWQRILIWTNTTSRRHFKASLWFYHGLRDLVSSLFLLYLYLTGKKSIWHKRLQPLYPCNKAVKIVSYWCQFNVITKENKIRNRITMSLVLKSTIPWTVSNCIIVHIIFCYEMNTLRWSSAAWTFVIKTKSWRQCSMKL